MVGCEALSIFDDSLMMFFICVLVIQIFSSYLFNDVCVLFVGTGIPLSVFTYNYYVALVFVLLVNPCICFVAAFYYVFMTKKRHQSLEQSVTDLGRYFQEYLFHPNDWFSLWRLNCRLVSYHSFITQSSDYRQEDKWTFLVEGKALDVPVSPFMTIESIVCKNKNIEGR